MAEMATLNAANGSRKRDGSRSRARFFLVKRSEKENNTVRMKRTAQPDAERIRPSRMARW
jgi:hypothetical protein